MNAITDAPLGLADTLGVEIRRGDTVRVTSWGHPVRLIDTGRVATVLGRTSAGNVVLVRDSDDPIARGRAVSPGMLAVARRDGLDGHEGNRPKLVVCGWYALCDRPADGFVSHPVLGEVPTCTRCATKHDLDLTIPALVGVESEGNSADRCYDCGAKHPTWFARYLTALWESPNASVTVELDERAREFSETEHAGCFL